MCGLLQDDEKWERCLENTNLNCMPGQLRSLFAILFVYAYLTDPTQIFYKFPLSILEDYIHHFKVLNRQYQPNNVIIVAHVADDILTYISHIFKSWNEF